MCSSPARPPLSTTERMLASSSTVIAAENLRARYRVHTARVFVDHREGTGHEVVNGRADGSKGIVE